MVISECSNNLERVTPEEVEVWKVIPNTIECEVSNLGRFRKKKNGEYFYPKQVKWKTSKGFYLVVPVKRLDGCTKYESVHRLVCLTFHGLPKEEHTDVNHKDGVKTNNRATNLEWSTRQDNVLHAFENNLCQSGVRVEARNLVSDTVLIFHSFSSAARYFEKPRYEFRTIVTRHKDRPYLNQWVFKVDDSSDKKLKRYQANDLAVKNYLDGSVTIYRDANAAEDATGIRVSSILFRTRPGRSKTPLSLIGGYVFKRLSDERQFPEYSITEAKLSRELNSEDSRKRMTSPVEVYDVNLSVTKTFPSKACFLRHIGKNTGTPLSYNKMYLNRYLVRPLK